MGNKRKRRRDESTRERNRQDDPSSTDTRVASAEETTRRSLDGNVTTVATRETTGKEDIVINIYNDLEKIHKKLNKLTKSHRELCKRLEPNFIGSSGDDSATARSDLKQGNEVKYRLKIDCQVNEKLDKGRIIETNLGQTIRVIMCDDQGEIVRTGPFSSAKVMLVVVNGDFNKHEIHDSWSRKDFEKNIRILQQQNSVSEDANQPVQSIVSNCVFKLAGGEQNHSDATILYNSRNQKVRLAVMILWPTEERVLEGLSNPFKVRDPVKPGRKRLNPTAVVPSAEPSASASIPQAPFSDLTMRISQSLCGQPGLQANETALQHSRTIGVPSAIPSGYLQEQNSIQHFFQSTVSSSNIDQATYSLRGTTDGGGDQSLWSNLCEGPMFAANAGGEQCFLPSELCQMPRINANGTHFMNQTTLPVLIVRDWPLDHLMPLYSRQPKCNYYCLPTMSLMEEKSCPVTIMPKEVTQTGRRTGVLIEPLEPDDSDEERLLKRKLHSQYQLQFVNKVCQAYYTWAKIKASDGGFLKVALFDENNIQITSGPLASASVEVVVLHGDFNVDDQHYWTPDEFCSCLVYPNTAKEAPSVLGGDCVLALADGETCLFDAFFQITSCHARTGKFKLGVKLARARDERIQEGISEPFRVTTREFKKAQGYTIDPAKCQLMTVEEKRGLVRELSKFPESALERLHLWSRREIIETLCAGLARERKYTGLSKQKMLNYLFRVVSQKRSVTVEHVQESVSEPSTSSADQIVETLCVDQTSFAKRPRKSDTPSQLTVVANNSSSADRIWFCQNKSCRAILNWEDKFCRHCSCCICSNYDDNKDPSLWLFCSSDQLAQKDSCGFSCHLECALKDERTGILQSGQRKKLDGGYYCTRCWKQNDLLGYWKKQLVIAKDAQRLDVLCHRISLSHKVLASTEKYLPLHEIVDTALKKLEAEVGPISGAPNMGRVTVNRLAVGAEVQKLCAQAIDAMELLFCGASPANSQMQRPFSSDFIKFEAVTQTSVTVFLDLNKCHVPAQQVTCFSLWHRVAATESYPSTPTGIILTPLKTLPVTGLAPATSYIFKIVAFNKFIELGSWEVKMKTSCQKEDPRGLMPGAAVLEQNTGGPKTDSDGPSDTSSQEHHCNFEYCKNPEILDSDKASYHRVECMDHLQNIHMGAARITEVSELEDAPGLSESALEEEPNSINQTAPFRQSSNSVQHYQRTAASGSQDTSNARAENVSLTVRPRYSGSVTSTAPRGTENVMENNGWSFKGQPCDSIVPYGSSDLGASYEYCVKVVRWLECEGYIETNFRLKFLTWFSLQATPHERKIVSVYVDTLIDDPVSLSGQLVDSFTKTIYRNMQFSMNSGS